MLGIFLVAVFGHTVSAQLCHPGWFEYKGTCYGFGEDLLSWAEAMTFCKLYGGTLAEPRDADINAWLKVQLRTHQVPIAWLGGTDIFHEGSWEWVSDKTVIGPFNDWVTGGPDNAGAGEDCMEMWASANYQWNDRDCEAEINFVCQAPLQEVIVGR